MLHLLVHQLLAAVETEVDSPSRRLCAHGRHQSRVTCNHCWSPPWKPKQAPGADPQEARRAATRRKVREHRQRLRAQGMRPIQIWVPDVHAPEFAAEARRQSLLVAQSPEEAEIQAFIDSVYEWPDDEYSQ